MTRRPLVAIEPECWRRDDLAGAVSAGGGIVVPAAEAEGLIWADPQNPDLLGPVLRAAPQLRWIQLPYAGIEPYLRFLDGERLWTCGKGVYAEPVAEMALGMLLAGMRGFTSYMPARSWLGPEGRNLRGAAITVLGGGGITVELLKLLAPFECDVTVLRRHPEPLPGTTDVRVVGPAALGEALAGSDAVVVALALTAETRGIIDAEALATMPEHCWLVNVARGEHVVTDDLTEALGAGTIAGAALDVTDPEPLPDGHPLWDLPNCIITPHVGNTPEMGIELLNHRVTENVRRYAAGEPLLGPVHVALGY
ncbi:MAG: D-isomer specific 2-hydroxyacid dehydrogenase family protein [bacterium]|nr:D-isomer specific 2-hydroxyacid dehydrogenase family protein [bacterium]